MLIHADTETPLTVDLPAFVVLEVTYTEPALRGDATAAMATKPATLETGATVQVPVFINTGDKLRIDTRTREYVERAK
jgi:elongation factor P